MARRRYHSTLQGMTSINITPLMDVTFLLLIVFMITAPVLEYEFDVSPPRMRAERIEERKSVMINVTASGEIMYERKAVSLEELTRRLAFVHEVRADLTALIRADGDLKYRQVIDVLKAVRAAKIENVSLVTQQEDE